MASPVVLGGRWQDVLPGTYDPARAVVITDPPYGLGAGGGLGIRAPGSHFGLGKPTGGTNRDTLKGYEDTTPWGRHVADVLELLPAKRYCIRGPATMLIRRDHPAPRRVCVEMAQYRRRVANRPGIVPYLWQGWAIYGRLKVERHRQAPAGDAFTGNKLLQKHEATRDQPRTGHRALTPYSAASWMVDTWADPGDLVVDPFAGLGTIGLAARDLGFDYIGAEMVPEYAAAAGEALATQRLTMGLGA